MARENVDAYLKTGHFPEGAVLVKDTFAARTEPLTVGTSSYAGDLAARFVMVKDTQQTRRTLLATSTGLIAAPRLGRNIKTGPAEAAALMTDPQGYVCQPLAAKPRNMLLRAASSSRWKGCGSNSAAKLLIRSPSMRARPEP
jgi:hypothetical protein